MFDDNMIRDQWKQIRGKAKEWWSKLTEDDLNYINGRGDRLISKLEERYSYTKEQAVQQIELHMRELQHAPQMGR
jgi:uncharacterized protein YjbJ (UPF0337 family)